MESININLKNCHGIGKLNHNFEFGNDSNNNTNISLIYAPNGTMKTSFAKTFKDLGNNINPKNLINNSEAIYNIKIKENGNWHELSNDEISKRIFVIDSFDDDFSFKDTGPLISNKEFRMEYEEILNDLINEKKLFLDFIKNKTKLHIPRNNDNYDYIENLINSDLNNDSKSFLEFLFTFLDEITDSPIIDIDSIKYDEIFNKDVLKLLNDENLKGNIESFLKNLEILISKSKIYNYADFNHNNAQDLFKSIKKNNLFKTGHQINFNGVRKNVSSLDELNILFDNQFDKIFEDESLKEDFDKINKKFSNIKTKDFQKFILENKNLIQFINDVDNFKRIYWFSVFNSEKELLLNLVNKFKENHSFLKEIRQKALNEQTEWQRIIKKFNKRFHVPFTLKLKNKEDVILKEDIPKIAYYFEENNDLKEISLDVLKEISSAGQKRAIYLLDILYKIENIKSDKQILLIFDDIADSFDYENKYAIIEYINELSHDNSFKIILLTHNFDFFRSLKSRLNCKFSYFANKNQYGTIKLNNNNFECSNNIFIKISNRINNDPENHIRDSLALIPFIRNLYEYKGDNYNKNFLTNILHYKQDGKSLTLNSLQKYYSEWNINVVDSHDLVYELIFLEADKILEETVNDINIINKIILSMAIRLKSEEFMLSKLKNIDKNQIFKNQTRLLFKEYKTNYVDNEEIINVLERVTMLTPENIHLNSFMYEPLLDMSDFHLKDLYKDVLNLFGGDSIAEN